MSVKRRLTVKEAENCPVCSKWIDDQWDDFVTYSGRNWHRPCLSRVAAYWKEKIGRKLLPERFPDDFDPHQMLFNFGLTSGK